MNEYNYDKIRHQRAVNHVNKYYDQKEKATTFVIRVISICIISAFLLLFAAIKAPVWIDQTVIIWSGFSVFTKLVLSVFITGFTLTVLWILAKVW